LLTIDEFDNMTYILVDITFNKSNISISKSRLLADLKNSDITLLLSLQLAINVEII